MRRKGNTRMGCLLALVAMIGCGASKDEIVGPDPAVQPFVGTWDAVFFEVTNTADPNTVADLMIDGSFNVNIQPSGAYTATLVFGGIDPVIEIGQVTVTGSFITFRPNGENPCPGSSAYTFPAPDRMTLAGPTCFDFNLDGESEDAFAEIELERR